MCLLDEVVEWDERHIRCRSATHRAADHPLRSRGRLGVACGIEYAAQAMAAHGALSGEAARSGRPEAGFLASLRDIRFYVPRLDDLQADLLCDAALVAGDHGTALYEFAVSSGAQRLLSGRATVVFDAEERLRK
jgi:predicted hotdog family 3-hydroxylacyl-ACP dehydratase